MFNIIYQHFYCAFNVQKCNFYVKISGKRHLTNYPMANGLEVMGRCASGGHIGFSLIKLFP